MYEYNYIFQYRCLRYWTNKTIWISVTKGEKNSANIIVHDGVDNAVGHCSWKGGKVVETFKNDNEILKRMEEICGARNYSLALRNCEHFARYYINI